MKKIFVFATCCIMVLIANARVFEAKIVIDYSSAYIHGMDEKSFAKLEEDWYKDKPGFNFLIIDRILDKAIPYLRINENADNTIKINVEKINSSGGFSCNVVCTKTNGDVVFNIDNVYNKKGGTIGSKLNLIKDGATKIGSKLGSAIKKELKKTNK